MDNIDSRTEFLALIDDFSQYLAIEIANYISNDLCKARYLAGARDAILFLASYTELDMDDIRIDDFINNLKCELDL